MSRTTRRLLPEQLRWCCAEVPYDDVEPAAAPFLGQDRAIRALQLGMEIRAPGYHIFVSGLTGTGRGRTVQHLIEKLQVQCRPIPDRCFVHDPEDPWRPLLLRFDAGQGQLFKEDVAQFGRNLLASLPRTLSSAALNARRQGIRDEFQARAQEAQAQLLAACQSNGHALVTYEENGEPDVFPVVGEDTVAPEQLVNLVREGKLDAEQAKQLEAARAQLLERLGETRLRLQALEVERTRRTTELDREAAKLLLARLLAPLRARWQGEDAREWFAKLQGSMIENLTSLHAFALSDQAIEAADQGGIRSLEVKLLPRSLPLERKPLDPPYAAPASVGEAAREFIQASCPVLYESDPSWENVFGSILGGGEVPSLGQIHSGSLLRAEGGYLILKLSDVLQQPGVWEQLKIALKSEQLQIRSLDRGRGEASSPLLPAPVPVDVKVVLIGEPGSFDVLAHQDPEFLKVFKVHAEFDTTIPLDDEGLQLYARQVKKLVQQEELLPPSGDGLAALAEEGRRLAGYGDRLSARFGRLSDLYREASHHARARRVERVEREDIHEAERGRRGRHALPEEQYLRGVERGLYVLELQGRRVGQVNGLVVLDKGTFAYGRPSRVTARVAVGNELISIERESEMSGPIYEKGVQILSGLLHGLFGGSSSLALHATLCFEQSYSGVDGDSASSTELFALLSALSGVPIDQGIAVTGAIDQFGRIQAIGGVNEKIEGFFEVCSRQGLTGDQGVLIPSSNVPELMLAPEIVEAVREERFGIFAMEDYREIRFAGDSGDGMQLTGGQFTQTSAIMGNDLATFPDFPAEIRAPAGTLPGVSAFQVRFSSFDIHNPGDHPDVLVAMNPAALKVHIGDLRFSSYDASRTAS
jgi:predicted ATP-dependent protease